MSLLEKENALLDAIHKEIPDVKQARVVTAKLFDYLRDIIKCRTQLTVWAITRFTYGDDSVDTSGDNDDAVSNLATTMSNINELCRQFHVDEMFPGVTPDSGYSDISGYASQYMKEVSQHAAESHKECEKKQQEKKSGSNDSDK